MRTRWIALVAGACLWAGARAQDSVLVPGAPLPIPSISVQLNLSRGGVEERTAIGTIPGADLPFSFSWSSGRTASGIVHVDPTGALQLIDFNATNGSQLAVLSLHVSTSPDTPFAVGQPLIFASTRLTGVFANSNAPPPPPFPQPFPIEGVPATPSFEAAAAFQRIPTTITFDTRSISAGASSMIDLAGSTGVRLVADFFVGIVPMNSLALPLVEVRIAPVPEPSSLQLLLAGVVGLATAVRVARRL